MSNIRKETLEGAKWGFLATVPTMPINFLFSMIMARLITPAEMGIVGLTGVFFSIAAQLSSAGFGAALIRKQNRTQKDNNTVFWYNILMSAIMAILLWLAAPWFALEFKQPALVDVTRFSAVMMFISSSAGVHQALFQARRDFKTPALIGIGSGLITMPFALWAAYDGWSYWAILYQGAATSIISLVAIWILSPWKPSLLVSWSSFKEFFGFGSKLVLSALISNVYIDLRILLVGKLYSIADLACFSRSGRLCQLPQNFVMGSLVGATYPILSTIQDDENRLIATFRKYCRFVSMLTSWAMITLAFSAYPIVDLCFGETWLDAALYAQIICFAGIGNPLCEMISQMYKVKGKTGLLVKRDIIHRPLAILALLIGASYSVIAICYAAVFAGISYIFLSMYFLKGITKISFREQLSDLLPYILAACLSNIPAYFINLTNWASIYQFTLSVSSSMLIFGTYLHVRKDPTWHMLFDFIREKGLLKHIPFLKKL